MMTRSKSAKKLNDEENELSTSKAVKKQAKKKKIAKPKAKKKIVKKKKDIVINLDDPKISAKITQTIKESYQMGHRKIEAFIMVCQIFLGKNIPTKNQALEWLYKMDRNHDLSLENIDKNYLTLLEEVQQGYMKMRHLVTISPDFIKTFNIVKNSYPRYAIGITPGISHEFAVLDYFHDEARRVQYFKSNEPVFPSNRAYQLHLIDPQHFLLYIKQDWATDDDHHRSSQLFLIYLNVKIGLWVCLNETEVKMNSDTTIDQDSLDLNKFVIFNYNMDDDCALIQFGHVSASKEIVLDGDEKKLGKKSVSCFNLQNGALSGIGFNYDWENDGIEEESDLDSPPSKIYYWALEEDQFVRKFDFQNIKCFGVETDVKIGENCAWFEGYCFVTNETAKDIYNLFTFNILTQRCAQIHLSFSTCPDLHFDPVGNLIANVSNYILYYEIRKPQKLQILIWREIRRQKMCYLNGALYDQAMKQLPQNSDLQPYSF